MTLARQPRHPTASTPAEWIEADTMDRLRFYAANTDRIGGRLAALDEEWTVERVMEGGGAALALTGVLLAAGDKRWLTLPAAVTAFMVQHATAGWSPPLGLLRRLGLRTAREVEIERSALKVLRGDFIGVPEAPPPTRAAAAIAAAQT